MFDVDKRIIVLSIARMADSIGNSFLIVILPIYIGSTALSLSSLTGTEIFGFTLQEEFFIGIVLSVFGLVSSGMQPLFGRLSDKLERRRIFVLGGILLLLLATLLYPLVDKYIYVVFVRFLQGIGAAMTIPVTVSLVNDYAKNQGGRGESFGVFNTFRLLGFGLGPILAGSVYQYGPYMTRFGEVTGLTASFIVSAATAFIGFVLVSVFIDDPDTTTSGSSSLEIDSNKSKLTKVLVIAICTFLLASAITMFTTLEEPITQRLDQTSLMFTIQFSIAILIQVVLQIPIGKLSDKIGEEPLIIVGFIVLVPSMIGQGIATVPIHMILSRLGVGISVALVFPTGLSLVGKIAGDSSGSYLSILTGAFGLGTAIGPLSSGILYNVGGFSTPFFVGSVLSFIAIFLLYFGLDYS
jgi:MFS family permease